MTDMNQCPEYKLQVPYKSWDLPRHTTCSFPSWKWGDTSFVHFINRRCQSDWRVCSESVKLTNQTGGN